MSQSNDEVINKILIFEEDAFSDYQNKLNEYQEAMHELGIEIRSNIVRNRAFRSHGGRVVLYDLKVENKLPGYYYGSRIEGSVYKDGRILSKQEFYGNEELTTSYFVLIFPLVRVWTTKSGKKIKEISFSETMFNTFDDQVLRLLQEIKEHLSDNDDMPNVDIKKQVSGSSCAYMQNISFKMPIDDVFEYDELIFGVIVTGYIELGTISPNSSVTIVDFMGNVQISSKISAIISQDSIDTLEIEMLESASVYQNGFRGVALVFNDKEVLDYAQNGMFVIVTY